MKEEGVWLEITNLVVPEWSDDLKMIKEMCEWLKANGFENCPLHFSRFHPMYKLTKISSTPVNTLNKAREIALEAGLNYVFIGNVPGTEAEHTYCPKCKEMVIERRGFHIVKNRVVNGKCSSCQEPVAGIWK